MINISSFLSMVPHLNPVDRKSLNGNYPGDPNGTQSQACARADDIPGRRSADVVVDLQRVISTRPSLVQATGSAGGSRPRTRGLRLVQAFGLNHIIDADMNPDAPNAGRSLSGRRGRKTVLVAEAGTAGRDARGVASLVDGLAHVLGSLHMLDRNVRAARARMWLDGAGPVSQPTAAGRVLASSIGTRA